jgi:hypothetical protein
MAVRRRRWGRRALRLVFLSAVSAAAVVVLASSVRAAGTTVDLDQWASTALAWQNGDLNGNNSRFPEGGIVPFRLAIENLGLGNHTLHINYDFTAGGHKAYDFLATWDITNKAGACAMSGGGVSSMCPLLPTSSSFAFPSDPFIANGLRVSGAQAYSGTPRRLTIWGGKITAISGPVHSGSVNGNSSADFRVTFTATRPAVLLAWGGHLAQSAYWDRAIGGPLDGAAQVSGAPWHMRTLQLDGAGNKNQDRSIQPSAIVGALPPFALAPTPTPTPRPPSPPTSAHVTPSPTPRSGGGGSVPAGPNSSPAARVTPPPTSTVDPGGGVGPGLAPAIVLLVSVLGIAVGLKPRRRSNRR